MRGENWGQNVCHTSIMFSVASPCCLSPSNQSSASLHARYPSRWYASNMRGVKNWLAVMCCGKALQNHEEQPRHERLWQHSQQQNLNLSTSVCFKTIPGCRPWKAGNGSVERAAASSTSVSPSGDGFLGTISRISPSWLSSVSSLLYLTLNLLMKQSRTMNTNKSVSWFHRSCLILIEELTVFWVINPNPPGTKVPLNWKKR